MKSLLKLARFYFTAGGICGTLTFDISAASLPIHSDFNSDTPGQAPAVGGPNQPSALFVSSGASVLVQSSAFGISSQPVVLNAATFSQYISVGYRFTPFNSGTLRIEATVSFNNLGACYFLQSAVDDYGAVVTRLDTDAGNIHAGGQTIGTFSPGTPFRARIDIDLLSKTWSAVIDDGLNGFGDDTVFSGLPFLNDPNMIDAVGFVGADLNTYGVGPLNSVAYDDISIVVVPEPCAFALTGLGAGALVIARRRR